MQGLVCLDRNNVLLGKHLDRVRDAVEQPQQPKPEDVGAVGTDPVLDQRRLLSFHPRIQPGKVQDREKHDPGQRGLDKQNFDHGDTRFAERNVFHSLVFGVVVTAF